MIGCRPSPISLALGEGFNFELSLLVNFLIREGLYQMVGCILQNVPISTIPVEGIMIPSLLPYPIIVYRWPPYSC